MFENSRKRKIETLLFHGKTLRSLRAMNQSAKYCGETKTQVSDCAAFKPLFARLKHLGLDACDFTGDANDLFNSCKQLETLDFDANGSCRFLAKKFPKLEDLKFDCGYPAFLTFFDMLQQNPQLKHLRIMAMADDVYIRVFSI